MTKKPRVVWDAERDYKPKRKDADPVVWALVGLLVLAIAMVAWRMPELLKLGVQ